MLKYIAHRCNMVKPNSDYENSIEGITKCVGMRFDVEIDLWFVRGEFYLGHDYPVKKVEYSFLNFYKKNLWVHAKHLTCLEELVDLKSELNYFAHSIDFGVLTSKGYIWMVHHHDYMPKNSVGVITNGCLTPHENCYGVCSDYVLKIRDLNG